VVVDWEFEPAIPWSTTASAAPCAAEDGGVVEGSWNQLGTFPDQLHESALARARSFLDFVELVADALRANALVAPEYARTARRRNL
jgi:hypothetical protein